MQNLQGRLELTGIHHAVKLELKKICMNRFNYISVFWIVGEKKEEPTMSQEALN